MVDSNLCPHCNAKLPVHTPSGVCPKCLMKAALAEDAEVTGPDAAAREGPGTKIGHYEVRKLVGEGGMGLVYLAVQKQPVRRQVALKIIKPGMDSKAVIARFEAERQALALLDHPNIARVYDADTTETGRPYFAMEYVRGKPITQYCDEHLLSIEQRLRLFEQICEAVHHAHQKGIIHRDLKPSNILVSLQDDRVVPKIIDFGIAKAISQPLTEKTLFTEQGQLLGTPEYMSPEQVDMATQDIDIRSDIYSLGIVLYELLVGLLPFTRESLPQPGLAELRRTIRDLEPASPSARLTRLGQNAQEIATRRQTQVALLARRLRRELEWIPLKAIRKERSRRYRSASEMADDIRNYLHGLPLTAGPETTLYRLQKFVSKHSGTVATVAVVAVAIILGLVTSTGLYVRAEKALEQEAESRTRAEQSEETAQEQRRLAEHLLARAQIERGIRRINEGDFYGLLDLVDAHETAQEIPELRAQAGRLWAVAYELCRDRLVHVLPGGSKVIYSPDGRLFAVKSDPNTVRLFDADTCQPHVPHLPTKENVHAIAFSPNSRLLVTHSVARGAQLWDTATGEPVGLMLKHSEKLLHEAWWPPEGPNAVAFSPDGQLLATAGFDGTVRIWRTDTGLPHGQLLEHDYRVKSVAFSPDGTLLATGSKETHLWDMIRGKWRGEPIPQYPQPTAVRKVIFSSDSQYLAGIGEWDQRIDVMRTDKGKLHHSLHVPLPWDGAVSPDGAFMAFTSFDWYTQLWATDTGEQQGETMYQDGRVYSVVFHPEGRLLATIATDKTARLWEVPSGEPYGQPLRHHDIRWSGTSVAFSPNGKFLASTAVGDTTRLWHVYQRIDTDIVPWPNGDQLGAISSDGKVGAIVLQNTVQLYDTSTLQGLGASLQHDAQVTEVAFSPNGRLLATVSADMLKVIQLWDVATAKRLRQTLQADYFINALTFSLDGKLLLIGSKNGFSQVFEVATGQCIHTTVEHDEWMLAVALSPDNQVLATALSNGSVYLWDFRSGQQLGPPLKHTGLVMGAAFSPDGKMLITVSAGMRDRHRVVRLWDVSTSPYYHSLELPFKGVAEKTPLRAFSEHGQLLLRRLPQGKAQVWLLPSVPETLDEIKLRTWVCLNAEHNAQGQPEMISPDQWRVFHGELQLRNLRKAQAAQPPPTIDHDMYRVPLPSDPEREHPGVEAELKHIYGRVTGREPPESPHFMNTLNVMVQTWESLSATPEKVDYKYLFDE